MKATPLSDPTLSRQRLCPSPEGPSCPSPSPWPLPWSLGGWNFSLLSCPVLRQACFTAGLQVGLV